MNYHFYLHSYLQFCHHSPLDLLENKYIIHNQICKTVFKKKKFSNNFVVVIV